MNSNYCSARFSLSKNFLERLLEVRVYLNGESFAMTKSLIKRSLLNYLIIVVML